MFFEGLGVQITSRCPAGNDFDQRPGVPKPMSIRYCKGSTFFECFYEELLTYQIRLNVCIQTVDKTKTCSVINFPKCPRNIKKRFRKLPVQKTGPRSGYVGATGMNGSRASMVEVSDKL